jgi:ferrous iron transport protein A
MAPLSKLGIGQTGLIQRIGGERAFRRRLMELGLVPGTSVEIAGVAPLGDPLKLLVRGCVLSIRRSEATEVLMVAGGSATTAEAGPASTLAPNAAKTRTA